MASKKTSTRRSSKSAATPKRAAKAAAGPTKTASAAAKKSVPSKRSSNTRRGRVQVHALSDDELLIALKQIAGAERGAAAILAKLSIAGRLRLWFELTRYGEEQGEQVSAMQLDVNCDYDVLNSDAQRVGRAAVRPDRLTGEPNEIFMIAPPPAGGYRQLLFRKRETNGGCEAIGLDELFAPQAGAPARDRYVSRVVTKAPVVTRVTGRHSRGLTVEGFGFTDCTFNLVSPGPAGVVRVALVPKSNSPATDSKVELAKSNVTGSGWSLEAVNQAGEAYRSHLGIAS